MKFLLGAWLLPLLVTSLWINLAHAAGNAAPPPAPAPAPAPVRVVSINLCTDILALELAPPGTLKSVYRLAADPEDSPVADLAKGIALNDGHVDEILGHRPDLVLAHEYSSPFALDFLRRAHIPVVKVKDATSFEAIRDNIRIVAAALGQDAKGEAMIARFDAGLAQARRNPGAHPPRVILYEDMGSVATDDMLLGRLLAHTGFENAVGAVRHGYGNLTVEELIARRPDLVIRGVYRPGSPSQASALLSHPALKAYLSRYAHGIDLSAKLWTCGSPHIAEIASRLAAARDAFPAGGMR